MRAGMSLSRCQKIGELVLWSIHGSICIVDLDSGDRDIINLPSSHNHPVHQCYATRQAEKNKKYPDVIINVSILCLIWKSKAICRCGGCF